MPTREASRLQIVCLADFAGTELKGTLYGPVTPLDPADIEGSIRRAFDLVADTVISSYRNLKDRSAETMPDAVIISPDEGKAYEIRTETTEIDQGPLFDFPTKGGQKA